MSATATKTEHRQFIGGNWVEASGGGRFDDLDPYTGGATATVPAGTREDARAAIEAAASAFSTWSKAPPAERQAVFLRAADVLESRSDEVVALLAAETGSSFGFGMFQMGFVPGLFRQAAGIAYSPIGEILPSDMPGAMAMGLRRPVGVVAAIAPWNAALILSARSISAPLALGNTVVMKPSEESPYVGGLLWGEIFSEAGLPDGVLNVVTHGPGQAGPIGEEFAENPHVRRINFTGSTATGRKLAELAGRNLKRVVLELGGYDTIIGPLINRNALETVSARVKDAVSKGAKLLAGGEAIGPCFQATVLTDVPEDSEFARVETFGPVAAVEVVENADEAIARANATSYGLASGILTGDPDKGLALAERLEAGIVHINDQPVHDEPQMPFGGVKDSGWGRFGGTAAIEEFTDLRWVTVQSGTRPFPF
jgi:acyl-CoA reductase-like NAD-dependent aldehyde dehydrogenase